MEKNQTNEVKPDRHEPDYQKDTYILLTKLKDHIVQIEALASYIFFCIAVMYAINEVLLPFPKLLILGALMAGFKLVMRVTNPNGSGRNRLIWATTFGGVAAIIGGAVDIASFGLTAGQGTLIGLGIGSTIGIAIGNVIETRANMQDLVERGEAFKILLKYSQKNPELANSNLINYVLDNNIRSFDINQDKRKWYLRKDLHKFGKKK